MLSEKILAQIPDQVIFSVGMSLADLEKLAILKTFKSMRFNKTQTALALGISIRGLDNKLHQYEGKPPEIEETIIEVQPRKKK